MSLHDRTLGATMTDWGIGMRRLMAILAACAMMAGLAMAPLSAYAQSPDVGATSQSIQAQGSGETATADDTATTSDKAVKADDDIAEADDTVTPNTGDPQPEEVNVYTGNGTNKTLLASLKLNRDNVGNVPALKNSDTQNLVVTFKAAGKPGDVFTITIPKSVPNSGGVYGTNDFQKLPADIGSTTSTQNADGSTTFTYRLTAAASIGSTINLGQGNSYTGQTSPMSYVGTMVKTITWTYNGKQLPPAHFTQVIKPEMNPTSLVRIAPTTQQAPAISVNTDYTYQININETNGVGTNGFPSNQVNSAVNYGTVIHIPVPLGFTLNETETRNRNQFVDGDKTTITQPGGTSGNIVITVPKGSGSQGWRTGIPGYRIVGDFSLLAPDKQMTVTAPGPITIVQQLREPDGAMTELTAEAPAWSDTLKSKDDTSFCTDGTNSCLSLSITGSSVSNQMLLPTNPAGQLPTTSNLRTLNFIGFGNNSPSALEWPLLTITVPSGFDATSIATPVSQAKLPGLTTYKYKITLLDGMVMAGSVDAGATITSSSGSPMRTIELSPNLIAAGSGTDIASSSLIYPCGILVDDNASCFGDNSSVAILRLNGTLSAAYDDGKPVQVGDKLTTTFMLSTEQYTMKDPNTRQWVSLNGIVKNTQTVIDRADLKATFGTYTSQDSETAGVKNSASMAISRTYWGDPTTQYVYEPIFYYVLPPSFVYDKAKGLVNTNEYPGQPYKEPKVTSAQTNDGREVVKIDFTGTGYWFDTFKGANQTIMLNISPDALVGQYPWQIYVHSPKTKLTQSVSAPSNLSYTMGDRDVALVGNGSFTVDAAKALRMTQLSQGNEATMFENSTRSNIYEAKNGFKDIRTMRFAIAIINGSTQDLQNVHHYVNLPQRSDAAGNGFTVTMTGPATMEQLPGVTTEPINEVRYSTSLAPLDNTEPDPSTYVTADKVTNWSAIKSIMVTLPTLNAGSVAGRLIIPGIDPTLMVDATKSAAISTGLYADNLTPIIVPANDKSAARITVGGHATITARLHWVDANGSDHYVDLPNLTKKYAVNDATFSESDYPQTMAQLEQQASAELPKNYSLEDVQVIGDDGATYARGPDGKPYPDGAAQWGKLVKYYYNHSIVQYNLISDNTISTMPITGVHGFWNIFTLSALVAGIALIPTLYMLGGMRRHGGK